eukprot:12271349-Karenia_brevis.AAC.1
MIAVSTPPRAALGADSASLGAIDSASLGAMDSDGTLPLKSQAAMEVKEGDIITAAIGEDGGGCL